MRVIAGDHKGRQLKAVPGKTTRPTTDKVKEAVFQVIGPFFTGGAVLDLFAGSGSLGIEALSRGMERAVFVDKHPKAIHTIHENLRTLNITGQAEVFRADAYRAVQAAAKRELAFSLILLDPPYKQGGYEKLLKVIIEQELLHPDGMIYCEHDTAEVLPETVGSLAVWKQENYGGTTAMTIYRR